MYWFYFFVAYEVDETRVLSGEMSKYIVSARKKDINWYTLDWYDQLG